MPYNIIYMWNLNYDISESIFETETAVGNRPVFAVGGGEGWSRRLGLADVSFYMEIDKQ